MKKHTAQNNKKNPREIVIVKLPKNKINEHEEFTSSKNIENPILAKTIKKKKNASPSPVLNTEERKIKTPDKTFGFSTFFIINVTLVVAAVIIIIIVLFAGGLIFPS